MTQTQGNADKITCKDCGTKDVPNWDGKGHCITCARDTVLGNAEPNKLSSLVWIKDLKCPSCGVTALFTGSTGYITCSNVTCANPDYSKALADFVAAQKLEASEKQLRFAAGVIESYWSTTEQLEQINKRIAALNQKENTR